MYFDKKVQFNLITWCLLAIFAIHNVEFVQSVILRPTMENATCEAVTYNTIEMYLCEANVTASEPYERVMINLDGFRMNCNDTLFIYGGPDTHPVILTCRSKTNTVIFSAGKSLSLTLNTTSEDGFNSTDFYLVYTPFKKSLFGCNDSYVCQDEYKYCIPKDYMCDGHLDCSNGSDEGMQCDMNTTKVIALVAFASFLVLLGLVWLCAHTRKMMRNREAIERNGLVHN